MDQAVSHHDRLENSDKPVEYFVDSELKDGNSSTDRSKDSSHEIGTEADTNSASNCSSKCGHQLPSKCSCYHNGVTMLGDDDSSCQTEQNSEVTQQQLDNTELTRGSLSSTLEPTDMLVAHSPDGEGIVRLSEHVNSESIADESQVRHGNLGVTAEENQTSVSSEGITKSSNEGGDGQLPEVEVDRNNENQSDPKPLDHTERPIVDKLCETDTGRSFGIVDSPQPLDFSMTGSTFAKTGTCVSVTKKQLESPLQNEAQKTAVKHDAKSDSYRPLGRLLHDLGLELVRQQVYQDLIDIQKAKDTRNQLEEHERGQLLKLVEAHDRLASRNAPYMLTTKFCSRCGFISSSRNVIILHQEFGTTSRVDPMVHVCCLCHGQPGFRTRSAMKFMAHLSTDHGLTGRLQRKTALYACENCQFEHKSSIRLAVHVEKCNKKFSIGTNLQPLPGDCDMPLIYRPSDRNRPLVPSAAPGNAAYAGTGPPSVRTMLSSLRQQIPGRSSFSHSQPGIPSLICEICGKLVDSREALWNHFRCAHHVELCRTTMRDKEPWMKCDVCSGRFWTYQGLSRHLLLAHNRALATSFVGGMPASPAIPRCHLCGGSQTSNPLTHFSAYHNVTLLEMYHAKLCCLCNRKVNSGRAFEEHMVTQHSDIFANHDVLRTVLQALTTARYFKADDTREPTAQHIRQLSANGGLTTDEGSSGPTNARKKQANSASSVAITDKTSHKNVMSPSKSPRTLHRKQNSIVVGSRGVDHNGCADVSETKHGSAESRLSHDGTTSSRSAAQNSEVKVKNKSVSVEEVKKLYEDLADLGRPILRSMRRKLNSNCDARNCASETNDETVSEQDTSVSPQETPAKKARLQWSDAACNDMVNC